MVRVITAAQFGEAVREFRDAARFFSDYESIVSEAREVVRCYTAIRLQGAETVASAGGSLFDILDTIDHAITWTQHDETRRHLIKAREYEVVQVAKAIVAECDVDHETMRKVPITTETSKSWLAAVYGQLPEAM